MKKKVLGIILCTTILITGCSNQKDIDSNKSDQQITIGFSQSGSVSEWNDAVATSIKDTFANQKDYVLLMENAEEEQEKQFASIRDFIKKDVDYIVASPLEESSQWEEVLSEAELAKIPVILIGNRIEIKEERFYAAWIGSDYLQQGYDAGDWLEEYLKESEEDKKEINIVMAGFSEHNDMIQERFQGFLEQKELSKLEHWKIWDYQENLTKAKEMLQSQKKVDVLVCGDDQIALELIETAEAAGKTCGKGGDIIVISFGTSKAGLEAVKEGKINADIEYNSSYGTYIEDVIKNLQEGNEVDKAQYVLEEIFTIENVDSRLERIEK